MKEKRNESIWTWAILLTLGTVFVMATGSFGFALGKLTDVQWIAILAGLSLWTLNATVKEVGEDIVKKLDKLENQLKMIETNTEASRHPGA